LGGKRW